MKITQPTRVLLAMIMAVMLLALTGCRSTPDYMGTGSLQMFGGDHEDAVGSFTEEINSNPANAMAYNLRGFSLSELGKGDEAMSDFMKAIELDPTLVAAYNNRGMQYVMDEQYAEALADFNKTLELNPEFAAAYSNRGYVYNETGRFDLAAQDFTKAIELDSTDYTDFSFRGIAYFNLDRYEEAEADFTNAIALEPTNDTSYFFRGIIYSGSMRLEPALSDLSRAIELDPTNAMGYFYRGELHYQLGQTELGVQDFTKMIALAPDEPDIMEAYTRRGLGYANLDRNPEAIADFSTAIENDPENWTALYYRGIMGFKTGDFDLTAGDMDRVIALNPVSDSAYFYRSSALFALGQYDRAITDMDLLIANQPENGPIYLRRAIAAGKISEAAYKTALAGLDGFLTSADKTDKASNEEDSLATLLARFFLGQAGITVQQITETAASLEDPEARAETLCVAYYFIGEFYLLNGNNKAARESFNKALDTGAEQVFEYRLAKNALMGSRGVMDPSL